MVEPFTLKEQGARCNCLIKQKFPQLNIPLLVFYDLSIIAFLPESIECGFRAMRVLLIYT